MKNLPLELKQEITLYLGFIKTLCLFPNIAHYIYDSEKCYGLGCRKWTLRYLKVATPKSQECYGSCCRKWTPRNCKVVSRIKTRKC